MYKISTVLFLIFIFTYSVFAQDDTRAGLTWQVQKYDITAALPDNYSNRNLTVKAVLNLKNISNSAASRLTLRISEKAEVTNVKANGAAADFSKAVPEKIDNNRNLQRTSVRLPSVAPNATVSVEVNYKLKVDENSGLNALSPAGSQFLPLSFWYPTPTNWFYPGGADFAPVNLTVVTPNNITAISSGSGGDPASSARTSYSYNQNLNAQPFFVTGNWDAVNNGGVTVFMPKGADAEAKKRADELAALANEAKSFTANLLGGFPDVPIQIVSSKRGAGFSDGGAILVDDGVFRRGKIDSLTAMTIAEAIAKIRLGNSVKVIGNGYGVIREGLSRFIATQFLENKYGKDVADIERLRQRTAYAAVSERGVPLNIVSPVDDVYYTEVANKGAMIWRILAKKIGQNDFFSIVRQASEDNILRLEELREAFSAENEFVEYAFNQVTDMNLLVGLPQVKGAETKVALRNAGSVEALVDVVALTANGEKLTTSVALRPKSFGEVTFKTTSKVIRVEIDPENFYPQTDYSDDIAPRELEQTDQYLAVKRLFDKQEFANAEKAARIVLRDYPRFDDVRILLARSLLAQNKTAEAEREFKNALEEKLPSSRTIAWANVGLGEIGAKSNRGAEASKYFEQAILADADYAASLAARAGRNNLKTTAAVDDSVKAFFGEFDKATVSNSKAQITALIVPGEVGRFASGLVGQTEQWTTEVLRVDKIDANNVLVETKLNIKLLSRNPESGTAVFRLTKTSDGWKLNNLEIFEVR